MKRIFLLIIASAFIFASCSDDWDKHYDKNSNNEDVSPLTLKEYFDGESEYTEFYNLLKSTGIDEELGRNQHLTIFAVKNANYEYVGFENLVDTAVAQYHICNLSFGISDLKQGLRIMASSGIYVTITESDGGFYANRFKIESSKRFKNGVVHEITSLMKPLGNMFEYLKMLNDDYSIIRDSILISNEKRFDRVNSTPIGVDPTGNTLYDSVFIDYNPIFEKINFGSEFEQFTLFLPNNEVIRSCFETMHDQYRMMGNNFTQEDTLLAMRWMKETIFHQGLIENYHEKLDLSTPYSDGVAAGGLRVWRTSVQQVDEDNYEDLSNGRVYKVTKLKIPNNVIISRIKSRAHYYEYLTDEQKETWYIGKGLSKPQMEGGIEVAAGDDTPKGAPIAKYWLLKVNGVLASTDELSVEFPPIDYNEETGEANIMKVPPGEYTFYMGFQSKNHAYVDIYFKQGDEYYTDEDQPLNEDIQAESSSPWNYDRVNETDKNIEKWDGLGGPVGTVNIEGDEMDTFRIKVKFNRLFNSGITTKRLLIYHWALKPTSNNY